MNDMRVSDGIGSVVCEIEVLLAPIPGPALMVGAFCGWGQPSDMIALMFGDERATRAVLSS